jgi:hypothetical protein
MNAITAPINIKPKKMGARIITTYAHKTNVKIAATLKISTPAANLAQPGTESRAVRLNSRLATEKISLATASKAAPSASPIASIPSAFQTSRIEPEMHHITVSNNILFSFQPELACLPRTCLALERHIIRIGNRL